MAAVHHIEDFESPRLPWPVRAFNKLARPLADRLIRIEDEEELMEAARRRTGLSDFGGDSFHAPLRALLASLRKDARLTPLGRFMTRQFLLQLLGNRLKAEDLISRYPQILAQEIHSPIFIVGLPRTGTTHLHNLISQDPALRSLPLWESLDPVPGDAEPPPTDQADPRYLRCAQALRFQHYLMPLFPLMHEMTPEARHEDIQLLAMDFSTMLFETMYRIPDYRDWYKAADQTAAYRYLERMLKLLQWLRGPKRWALKSPQHLEQIGPLMSVFPDARIIQTHRDPVRITASMCTMAGYGLRAQNEGIKRLEVGRYWSDRIEDLLRAAVNDRSRIPQEQVIDVYFHEFMQDDAATAERVLEFAGQPVGAEARTAIARYMDEHPRGKHGTVAYRLEQFGIDATERREKLRFYRERFDVPDE